MPDVTKKELLQLQAALDYLVKNVDEVVHHANTPNDKLRYMHESKRMHQLAKDLLKVIWERNDKS